MNESETQAQWKLIAGQLRKLLATAVNDPPTSITAGELEKIAEASMTLFWLEYNAACFDVWTALEAAR